MRVGILGPLEVVVGGEVVDIGGARLRTLLIRLALDAGRTVTVDALTDALWHDDPPADRANALQSLVSRLRQALPDRALLRSVPGGYCLDVPGQAVDALRFERLSHEGRRALKDGNTGVAAHRLREALELWRGAALADVRGADFAAAAIARLDELRLTVTEDRIAADLAATSRPSHLVAELEELVATHPLRERLRVLLIRALHADGRQAEALAAYEQFRILLADELGADPGREVQDAHLAVLRGERPSQRPGGVRPQGNLRAALTSFVGRARERARIDEQLGEGRLVTLVGPGGAGKTRLATTFAAARADVMSGGVWLVDLAAVTAPVDVAQAVIGALGLRDVDLPDGAPSSLGAMSRVVEALAATETLLVLDNCEHVIDAVARFVEELLGRCPGVRVLATSREPLGIFGEALCPVSPLGLPEPGVRADEAMDSPAMRLFADRAAAVRPDFAVTDDNVAVVTEICRRLDGLPLAIELAAARLRSLTIAQVAAGLDDRFRLLTGGSRTAVARHQTLRAVVGWSWDLLDDDERGLAERLAVFPATITPDSAAYVHEGSLPVLDTLSALVDKSLLQTVEGQEPRYRMLETIREYALERLAETGRIAPVRAAHAAYFLRLAETAEPHLLGPGQIPWIRRLVAEHDNLLAALHYVCDTGDAASAVRLGAALSLFWTIRGNHAEAASWLRRSLDVPGEAPQDARMVATAVYLFNTVLSGDHGGAGDAVQELRSRLRVPRSASGHPASVLIEAALALVTDDTAEGLAVIDRRLSHADPWKRAMLWMMRAFLQANASDMDAMARDMSAAVDGFRAAGERWGLATSLANLAYARMTLGQFDDAIIALEESIRLLRELDASDEAVLQRAWLAVARSRRGDVAPARADLLELVGSRVGRSSARSLAFARLTLGDLARHDGDLEEAARQYGEATDALGRVPFEAPVFHAMLRAAMGQLAVARGELDAARTHLAEAFTLAGASPDMPLVAVVAVGVAWLRLRCGAPLAAAEVLGAAHALRGAPDAFNPDVATLAGELRAALDERAYQAAYDRGRDMDRTAALALIEGQLR